MPFRGVCRRFIYTTPNGVIDPDTSSYPSQVATVPVGDSQTHKVPCTTHRRSGRLLSGVLDMDDRQAGGMRPAWSLTQDCFNPSLGLIPNPTHLTVAHGEKSRNQMGVLYRQIRCRIDSLPGLTTEGSLQSEVSVHTVAHVEDLAGTPNVALKGSGDVGALANFTVDSRVRSRSSSKSTLKRSARTGAI
jgi:hypothetical protein